MIYKKIVSQTFYEHGVDNKDLENAMIDLFSKFESHMLSDRFIRELDTKLQKHAEKRKRAWGG